MTALGYQDIPARIEQLKAHLNTPRGRKDHQSWRRLAELCKFLKDRTTSVSFDELLKTYYNLETSKPLYEQRAPWLSMIKAHEDCPRDRFYVIVDYRPVAAVHADDYTFVEEPVAKYRCDDCEELIEIVPNGVDPKTSNKRQRLIMHPNKKTPGELCRGSGKDV